MREVRDEKQEARIKRKENRGSKDVNFAQKSCVCVQSRSCVLCLASQISTPSIIPQIIHRIASSGFEGLVADGQPCDKDGNQAGCQDHQYINVNPVSKILQPELVHDIIGQRA